MSETQPNLSIVAETIVSNALQYTLNLYCPFCADAFMFEFTLKDHLRKVHSEELCKRSNDKENLGTASPFNCPYCGAQFSHLGLIPKHIVNHHSIDELKVWQRKDENLRQIEERKDDEPSILYAACSPGLSDIYNRLDPIDGMEDSNQPEQIVPMEENPVSTPNDRQLKSILKKTPKMNNIICSPSSVGMRRNKGDAVKRSISARRELRFDLPDISPNSVHSLNDTSLESNGSKRPRIGFRLKNLFCSNGNRKRTVNRSNGSTTKNKIITSTPINLLDDDPEENRRNWKETIRTNRPLFYTSERYQCAQCKKQWISNSDLLAHIRTVHRGLRNWLRPQYRCGQCGHTFYSNSHLIRHCRIEHTPIKMKRTLGH